MELNYGSDEHFMREALKEAKEALGLKVDEIPVGADSSFRKNNCSWPQYD
ncbi:MAG: hypothetical protein R2847_04160 [Bacteroidia bacterium]